MIKRIIFIVAVTAVAILGFAYWQNSHGEDAHTEEHEHEHEEVDTQNIELNDKQVKAVDLKWGAVETRELDATIQVNGTLVLRAQHVGLVTSLMGGVVKKVYVKEGQHVSKGQVVATIENTDVLSLQREYFTTHQECEAARQEMERQKLLAANGAGVKKNLQLSQKDYQIARASMVGIAHQLQQVGISVAAVAKGNFTAVFPLRAPVSGTVSELTASVGSYADMQSPLMKVSNNKAVECDLNVFEKDINKIKTGNRVYLSLTNQTGVKLTGHVYGMNESFNKGTKSVAVHVKLDAAPGVNLFDGMYVSGQIATGRQMCFALPDKAIVSAEGKQYVFALNQEPQSGKYSFSRHEVTTGVSTGGYTEVTLCKHVKDGLKIVTDNAFYLASLTGEHGDHH